MKTVEKALRLIETEEKVKRGEEVKDRDWDEYWQAMLGDAQEKLAERRRESSNKTRY